MSVYRKFQKAATAFPEKIALQIKENGKYKHITYSEMLGKVDALALSMADMAIAKGDRVAILSENRPEWTIALFAINLAGGVAVPLDFQLTAEELQNLIADSESKLVFTSSSLAGAVTALRARPKIISFDGDAQEGSISFTDASSGSQEKRGIDSLPEVGPENQAILLYTSGTTGKPKGVMLSNNNLLSNAEGLHEAGLCSHWDNFVSILPLHHAYPLMLNLILPLTSGACVTFARSLKRTELGECVRETGGTILVGVPQVFTLFNESIMGRIKELPLPARAISHILLSLAWVSRRFFKINAGKLFFREAHRFFGPKLHFLASGGARLDPAVEKNLLRLGFTVLQGYGLTETSPVVTFTRKGRARIGSAGLPLPGVELRIDSPNEAGEGEIMVKGQNVMLGYYRNEEETAAVIRDGWLATGDIGHSDRKGFLSITGRLKEVIVLASGMNVYPEEVENHYLKSPYIKELCVIAGKGAGLFALILPDFDYMRARGETYSHDAIRWQVEALSLKLPPYKRIMGYEVIRKPLPRTRLGKIKRGLIMDSLANIKEREEPAGGEADEYDLELLGSEGATAIISLIEGLTEGKKKIGLDDNLELDLGIDSLGRTQLLADVEEMFASRIPEETVARIMTVRDLVKAVSGTPHLKAIPGKRREVSWGEILKGDPLIKLEDIIPQDPGPFSKLILFIIHKLLRLLFAIYFRVHLEGVDNIPQKEPFILCPNHTSFLDSTILGASLPYFILRRLHFVALTSYFSGASPLKVLVRILKIIMTDASENLLSSMQLSAQVVKNGSFLCIFPEGGRAADGEVHSFKKGVGILAKELDVPLVPVLIDGTYRAFPKGASFPRPRKVRITIGKPIRPDQLDLDKLRSAGQDDYKAISSYLRKEIISLKNKNTNH